MQEKIDEGEMEMEVWCITSRKYFLFFFGKLENESIYLLLFRFSTLPFPHTLSLILFLSLSLYVSLSPFLPLSLFLSLSVSHFHIQQNTQATPIERAKSKHITHISHLTLETLRHKVTISSKSWWEIESLTEYKHFIREINLMWTASQFNGMKANTTSEWKKIERQWEKNNVKCIKCVDR